MVILWQKTNYSYHDVIASNLIE